MTALVYSYSRFSDPRQAEGQSLERQRNYAAEWAAKNGLQLDESLTMQDEGLSAYHQRHITSGALGVFLAAVEDRRIAPGSVLVVEGLDRLSRAEPMVAQAQLASIVSAGITVVTASDGQAYSREILKREPMKLIYSLLVMIRAHEESDTKSVRVTTSIVSLCKGWVDGTYKGFVRQGKDPQWLQETATGFQHIPDRVDALREAVALYKAGHSGQSISKRLVDSKQSPLNLPLSATHLYKILKNPNLVGTKTVEAGGQEFALEGYYPPVLTVDEWADLKSVGGDRGRRGAKSTIPHVITGLGITYCGYCGKAMSGQHLFGKIKVRGDKLKDGYRRLLCASRQYGDSPCPYPTSRSVAPIERAIMSYCSDIINLRALYGGDRAAPLRKQLTEQRTRQTEVSTQSERLMEIMLAASSSETPAMFVRRAQELEAEKLSLQRSIAHTEAQISSLARNDVDGVQAKWASLVLAPIQN